MVLIPTIGGCFNIFMETRNWDFIQSVGGIDIGKPFYENNIWFLPVKCDVSGLQQITIKPTLLNSALACAEVEAKIENRNIYLTVKTALVDKKENSPICGDALLGEISGGEYEVFYKGTDGQVGNIGKIKIKP